MRGRSIAAWVGVVSLLGGFSLQAQSSPQNGAEASAGVSAVSSSNAGGTPALPGTVVPRLVQFSGTVTDSTGKPAAGAVLPPGSGSWTFVSDRNVKRNFASVSGPTLLARLEKIPILTWSYRAQSASIRHMGPMAQDFRAAFGLGEDDKHISTVDAEGVALAAIQELYRRSQESEVRSQESEERQRHS